MKCGQTAQQSTVRRLVELLRALQHDEGLTIEDMARRYRGEWAVQGLCR